VKKHFMSHDPFESDREQLRRQIGRLRRRLDGRLRTAIGIPAWLVSRPKQIYPLWSLGLILAAAVGWLLARGKTPPEESSP
jgi:hypothetical protein